MNTKVELYRPQDPDALKRQYHAWRAAVCAIAAAAVARKNGLLDDTVFTAETGRTGKEQIA